MDILHDILLVVITLGLGWVIAYFKRKGRNAADKSDKRELMYESKKGEHEAIEEDQIQLTHKERLIRIMYLAEKINQSINKYVLYFYDKTSRAKFDQLVEDLNALLTDLYHEQRLANLFLPESHQSMLDNLLTNASGLVTEMCVNATNAGAHISTYKDYMELSRYEQSKKAFYWNKAIECAEYLKGVGSKPLAFKEDYQDAITKYANWLGEYIKQDIRIIEFDLQENKDESTSSK